MGAAPAAPEGNIVGAGAVLPVGIPGAGGGGILAGGGKAVPPGGATKGACEPGSTPWMG